jgi:hypothetical protein
MEQEELEELTAEEEHYAAMEAFVCATENIRFVESHDNWEAMTDYLNEHNLDVTPQNLRFAFLSLSKDGLLDLFPLGHLAPPQQTPEPTPTPTVQPPPVVARARTFVAFRNGAPISGSVRPL